MGDEVFCQRTGHWVSAAEADRNSPGIGKASGQFDLVGTSQEMAETPQENLQLPRQEDVKFAAQILGISVSAAEVLVHRRLQGEQQATGVSGDPPRTTSKRERQDGTDSDSSKKRERTTRRDSEQRCRSPAKGSKERKDSKSTEDGRDKGRKSRSLTPQRIKIEHTESGRDLKHGRLKRDGSKGSASPSGSKHGRAGRSRSKSPSKDHISSEKFRPHRSRSRSPMRTRRVGSPSYRSIRSRSRSPFKNRHQASPKSRPQRSHSRSPSRERRHSSGSSKRFNYQSPPRGRNERSLKHRSSKSLSRSPSPTYGPQLPPRRSPLRNQSRPFKRRSKSKSPPVYRPRRSQSKSPLNKRNVSPKFRSKRSFSRSPVKSKNDTSQKSRTKRSPSPLRDKHAVTSRDKPKRSPIRGDLQSRKAENASNRSRQSRSNSLSRKTSGVELNSIPKRSHSRSSSEDRVQRHRHKRSRSRSLTDKSRGPISRNRPKRSHSRSPFRDRPVERNKFRSRRSRSRSGKLERGSKRRLGRSLSRSPLRRRQVRSPNFRPKRSLSRSPIRGRAAVASKHRSKRSLSRSPVRARPVTSPKYRPKRSPNRSPLRKRHASSPRRRFHRSLSRSMSKDRPGPSQKYRNWRSRSRSLSSDSYRASPNYRFKRSHSRSPLRRPLGRSHSESDSFSSDSLGSSTDYTQRRSRGRLRSFSTDRSELSFSRSDSFSRDSFGWESPTYGNRFQSRSLSRGSLRSRSRSSSFSSDSFAASVDFGRTRKQSRSLSTERLATRHKKSRRSKSRSLSRDRLGPRPTFRSRRYHSRSPSRDKPASRGRQKLRRLPSRSPPRRQHSATTKQRSRKSQSASPVRYNHRSSRAQKSKKSLSRSPSKDGPNVKSKSRQSQSSDSTKDKNDANPSNKSKPSTKPDTYVIEDIAKGIKSIRQNVDKLKTTANGDDQEKVSKDKVLSENLGEKSTLPQSSNNNSRTNDKEPPVQASSDKDPQQISTMPHSQQTANSSQQKTTESQKDAADLQKKTTQEKLMETLQRLQELERQQQAQDDELRKMKEALLKKKKIKEDVEILPPVKIKQEQPDPVNTDQQATSAPGNPNTSNSTATAAPPMNAAATAAPPMNPVATAAAPMNAATTAAPPMNPAARAAPCATIPLQQPLKNTGVPLMPTGGVGLQEGGGGPPQGNIQQEGFQQQMPGLGQPQVGLENMQPAGQLPQVIPIQQGMYVQPGMEHWAVQPGVAAWQGAGQPMHQAQSVYQQEGPWQGSASSGLMGPGQGQEQMPPLNVNQQMHTPQPMYHQQGHGQWHGGSGQRNDQLGMGQGQLQAPILNIGQQQPQWVPGAVAQPSGPIAPPISPQASTSSRADLPPYPPNLPPVQPPLPPPKPAPELPPLPRSTPPPNSPNKAKSQKPSVQTTSSSSHSTLHASKTTTKTDIPSASSPTKTKNPPRSSITGSEACTAGVSSPAARVTSETTEKPKQPSAPRSSRISLHGSGDQDITRESPSRSRKPSVESAVPTQESVRNKAGGSRKSTASEELTDSHYAQERYTEAHKDIEKHHSDKHPATSKQGRQTEPIHKIKTEPSSADYHKSSPEKKHQKVRRPINNNEPTHIQENRNTTPEYYDIFVVGLTHNITKTDLGKYFSKFGEIQSVTVPTGKFNKPMKYCFIRFVTNGAAERVIREGRLMMSNKGKKVHHCVRGRYLVCEIAGKKHSERRRHHRERSQSDSDRHERSYEGESPEDTSKNQPISPKYEDQNEVATPKHTRSSQSDSPTSPYIKQERQTEESPRRESTTNFDETTSSPDDETSEKESSSSCRLHVSRLGKDISNGHLRKHFGKYGYITELKRPAMGYAFITFENESAVERAIDDGKVVGHDDTSVHYLWQDRSVECKRRSQSKEPLLNCQIFVSDLFRLISARHLKQYFGKYGEILGIDRPKKSYCFITFANPSSVDRVIEVGRIIGHGGKSWHLVKGRYIECQRKTKKAPSSPRSLGELRGGPLERDRGDGEVLNIKQENDSDQTEKDVYCYYCSTSTHSLQNCAYLKEQRKKLIKWATEGERQSQEDPDSREQLQKSPTEEAAQSSDDEERTRTHTKDIQSRERPQRRPLKGPSREGLKRSKSKSREDEPQMKRMRCRYFKERDHSVAKCVLCQNMSIFSAGKLRTVRKRRVVTKVAKGRRMPADDGASEMDIEDREGFQRDSGRIRQGKLVDSGVDVSPDASDNREGSIDKDCKRLWIIGDNILDGAQVQAMETQKEKFGMPENTEINWFCYRGATLMNFMGNFRRWLQSTPPPTYAIVHLGTNDMATFDEDVNFVNINKALDSIQELVPDCVILWSEIIPRLCVHKGTSTETMAQKRVKLNEYAIRKVHQLPNAFAVRHNFDYYRLFREQDPLHLSVLGLDKLLRTFRVALQMAINPGNSKCYPSCEGHEELDSQCAYCSSPAHTVKDCIKLKKSRSKLYNWASKGEASNSPQPRGQPAVGHPQQSGQVSAQVKDLKETYKRFGGVAQNQKRNVPKVVGAKVSRPAKTNVPGAKKRMLGAKQSIPNKSSAKVNTCDVPVDKASALAAKSSTLDDKASKPDAEISIPNARAVMPTGMPDVKTCVHDAKAHMSDTKACMPDVNMNTDMPNCELASPCLTSKEKTIQDKSVPPGYDSKHTEIKGKCPEKGETIQCQQYNTSATGDGKVNQNNVTVTKVTKNNVTETKVTKNNVTETKVMQNNVTDKATENIGTETKVTRNNVTETKLCKESGNTMNIANADAELNTSKTTVREIVTENSSLMENRTTQEQINKSTMDMTPRQSPLTNKGNCPKPVTTVNKSSRDTNEKRDKSRVDIARGQSILANNTNAKEVKGTDISRQEKNAEKQTKVSAVDSPHGQKALVDEDPSQNRVTGATNEDVSTERQKRDCSMDDAAEGTTSKDVADTVEADVTSSEEKILVDYKETDGNGQDVVEGREDFSSDDENILVDVCGLDEAAEAGISGSKIPVFSSLGSCQMEPDQEDELVWVVGDSFIQRIKEQAEIRQVEKLHSTSDVFWYSNKDITLHTLPQELHDILQHNQPPTIMIIHLGSNDFVKVEMKLCRTGICHAITMVRRLLPRCHIIWSSLPPRLFYYGYNGSGFISQKAMVNGRKKLNHRAKKYIFSVGNASYLEHEEISSTDHRLFEPDGMHLSKAGLDKLLDEFLAALQAVRQFY